MSAKFVGFAVRMMAIGALAALSIQAARAETPLPAQMAAASSRADSASDAARFVQAYAMTGETKFIVRWYDRLCVQMVGLAPTQAAAVKARIEAVAQPVGRYHVMQSCPQQNVAIVFTTDAQRTLDDVVAHHPRLLGGPHSDTTTVKTVVRPIQAWYQTELCDVCGGKRVEFLDGALVLVDLSRTGDTTLAAITDYVAMLILSEPRSPDRCQALPSLLDLFAGTCPDRAAPTGLTRSDLAYLKAVYSADRSITGALDGGTPSESPSLDEVAGRMGQLLAGAAPLPSPGAAPVR